jgi:hypothetical protein
LVLAELAEAGVQPTEHTPPERVREFLSDLYRWQLRQLRDQLLARAFPKFEYADRVVSLRRRYVLLSVPLEAWTEPEGAPGPPSSA